MTKKEFDNLREGDLVRNSRGEGFVIHVTIDANSPKERHYVGVRAQFISDPETWTLLKRMVEF